MDKLFKVVYQPRMVTVTTTEWNGRDSDELYGTVSRKDEVQKGTLLFLKECSINMEPFEALRKAHELCYEAYKILGTLVNEEERGFWKTPGYITCNSAVSNAVIAEMSVEENIVAQCYYVIVHYGMKGTFITQGFMGKGHEPRVEVRVHEKFPKYENTGIMKFRYDAEDNSAEMEDAQKLLDMIPAK
jgi:hypothetical protein